MTLISTNIESPVPPNTKIPEDDTIVSHVQMLASTWVTSTSRARCGTLVVNGSASVRKLCMDTTDASTSEDNHDIIVHVLLFCHIVKNFKSPMVPYAGMQSTGKAHCIGEYPSIVLHRSENDY